MAGTCEECKSGHPLRRRDCPTPAYAAANAGERWDCPWHEQREWETDGEATRVSPSRTGRRQFI